MSIATLKRKTQAKYNTMSVGADGGFSLNGTHRNIGYIGQTSLSRSLPRTPMKGATAKGHGGCCGTYLQRPIIQSGVTSPEYSSTQTPIIKPSVMSMRGMLSSKYRWVGRPQPFTTVKISKNTMTTTDDYIINKSKKAVNETIAWNKAKYNTIYPVKTRELPYTSEELYFLNQISRRNFLNTLLCKTTKPIENLKSAIPYSQYIKHAESLCVQGDKYYQVKNQRTPLPA